MPLNPAFSVPEGTPLAGDASNSGLQAEYDQLRAELQCLMMAPVKDFLRIDHLVDQLELLQLAIKGKHGIKGNNPNE